MLVSGWSNGRGKNPACVHGGDVAEVHEVAVVDSVDLAVLLECDFCVCVCVREREREKGIISITTSSVGLLPTDEAIVMPTPISLSLSFSSQILHQKCLPLS